MHAGQATAHVVDGIIPAGSNGVFAVTVEYIDEEKSGVMGLVVEASGGVLRMML